MLNKLMTILSLGYLFQETFGWHWTAEDTSEKETGFAKGLSASEYGREKGFFKGVEVL